MIIPSRDRAFAVNTLSAILEIKNQRPHTLPGFMMPCGSNASFSVFITSIVPSPSSFRRYICASQPIQLGQGEPRGSNFSLYPVSEANPASFSAETYPLANTDAVLARTCALQSDSPLDQLTVSDFCDSQIMGFP